ncbi:hypothetical protein [Ktedonobacter racemifer]|uniref:PsbP C-terminal domain-containing protein n=1 Tax=Ktedonobacter racemifer DSM 44963 TaxID=485913 RepID=D6TYD1_KTERA|nr:hypothetical protein [Ktedonobacter racemifer]EFH83211.1 hypothetical protein Krac_4149 [Ktedonobacter racemifer DSM 44963]
MKKCLSLRLTLGLALGLLALLLAACGGSDSASSLTPTPTSVPTSATISQTPTPTINSTPAPTPTPQGKALADGGTQNYHNSYFAFNYPANWNKTQESDATVLLTAPNNQETTIDAEKLAGMPTSDSLKNSLQEDTLVKQAASPGAIKQQTFNNISWWTTRVQVSRDGKALYYDIAYGQDQANLYKLVVCEGSGGYDGLFDTVLDSFQPNA